MSKSITSNIGFDESGIVLTVDPPQAGLYERLRDCLDQYGTEPEPELVSAISEIASDHGYQIGSEMICYLLNMLSPSLEVVALLRAIRNSKGNTVSLRQSAKVLGVHYLALHRAEKLMRKKIDFVKQKRHL